ncbi:MAG: IS30 family transposase [Mycoplasma sp.]
MLYNQITNDERKIIDYLWNQQKRSISFIARELNRSKSTISRELKRNQTIDGYVFEIADEKYEKRQWHKHCMHTLKYEEFSKLFLKYYDKRCHGVEATYNKIINNHPNIKSPSLRQIFNWIKNNRWVIKRSNRLRQFYKRGGKRTVGIFSKFNNKRVLPIWTRPKYIDNRSIYGHWEVDLVIGKKTSGYANLLTLTERKTRETYISKIYSKNPMKCNSEIYKLIKKNNLQVNSITCDNGIEFEKIGLLANWLDCMIYFCEPYASYQRGSNEHANGIIRRWYKKGTNFSEVTDQEIIELQNTINNMPRKIFNWLSSSEYKMSL